MRHTLMLAMLGTALALTACGDSANSPAPVTPTPVPTPTPTPTPTPVAANYDVVPCLNQVVPGTGGLTVANLVVPDVLTLDFSKPSSFPNGRQLADPVIDVTLAVIFLDLTKHSPDILAKIPLGPPANEVPFRADFPYLAVANGTVPTSLGGSNFNFRTDPASAYVQVDRMGMPAVSTALISSGQKIAYNDAMPSNDINGDFVSEIAGTLTGLTNALADDFIAAGLTPCAKQR